MLSRRLTFIARLALPSILAASLCSCSQGKKSGHLSKADEYFAAGDYEKAEIEYKNVMQLGELDPHVIARLGLIYFEQGRLTRAFAYLQKASELQPENLDVRLKSGSYYLATGRLEDARNAAIYVLERKPQDAEAPVLLAESSMQAKDVADAYARLQKLPKPASDGAPVLNALAILELRARKYKEAEALLERARQTNANLASVNYTLGRLYWAKNDLVRADKALATAAEQSPLRAPARLQYINFKLQTGHADEGKRLAEDLLRKAPDFLPVYMLLAGMATSEKKYDECVALLEKILVREPEHPEALLLTAQAMLARGDKDKALATLEKTVSLYPQSPLARYQLGSAYLAQGDLTNATSHFAQAVKLAPNYAPAVLALARTHVRQGNYAPAVTSLKALLQQNPGNNDVKLLLAESYRGQGNLPEASALYKQLEGSAPRNPEILVMNGAVLLQQNKKTEAREAFTKALEIAPDYLPPLEQLVNLDLLERQPAAAQARLEAQIAKNPKSAELQMLLAKVHLVQNKTALAETTLQKVIELRPDSSLAYSLLAQLYINSKQIEKALVNLQAAAAKNPKDFGPVMLTGVLQEQQKNFPAARDSYEKAVAINPKAGGALNNLAYLYAEHFGELEKAQQMAQRAREALPGQPEAADTLGWVLFKRGQYARALPLLQESSEKLPDLAEARFHLGMVNYMLGEEDAAREALQRALQLSKDFPGAADAQQSLAVLAIDPAKAGDAARTVAEQAISRRPDDPVALARLGAIYELGGKAEKAIGAYETALKTNPGNVNVTLRLISLYRSRNELPKAIEAAKNTRKLAPSDAKLAHALGRLAYDSGDHVWSASLLQEAARRQTGDPELLFDLAEAAYSVGQVSAAETALQEAVQISPSFPRAPKARQFLEMLEIAREPAKAADAAGKVDAILKSAPSDLPALMARAALDEQKGDFKSARQSYEKILSRLPDFALGKKRLALLYSAIGEDPEKGAEIAAKARDAYPNDAEVAKAFGVILYRQKNYARAASLLQESARNRPKDGEVMYYLGMSQRQVKEQSNSARSSLQRALELGIAAPLQAEAKRALDSIK